MIDERGPTPFETDGVKACATCRSSNLTSGRLSATESDHVDLFACDSCGDFWFERDGRALTADAMRHLGLLP